MKIIFTGGGTGGHVFPILAICREIRKNHPDLKLYFIGPKEKYAYDLLKKENVVVKRIITGKIRTYFSLNNILDLLKIPIGIIQGFFWVFVLSPDMVFSKGGHGSFPVSLAANILGVPFFLHESDAVPGKASLVGNISNNTLNDSIESP